jgi:hypothetical protein
MLQRVMTIIHTLHMILLRIMPDRQLVLRYRRLPGPILLQQSSVLPVLCVLELELGQRASASVKTQLHERRK